MKLEQLQQAAVDLWRVVLSEQEWMAQKSARNPQGTKAFWPWLDELLADPTPINVDLTVREINAREVKNTMLLWNKSIPTWQDKSFNMVRQLWLQNIPILLQHFAPQKQRKCVMVFPVQLTDECWVLARLSIKHPNNAKIKPKLTIIDPSNLMKIEAGNLKAVVEQLQRDYQQDFPEHDILRVKHIAGKPLHIDENYTGVKLYIEGKQYVRDDRSFIANNSAILVLGLLEQYFKYGKHTLPHKSVYSIEDVFSLHYHFINNRISSFIDQSNPNFLQDRYIILSKLLDDAKNKSMQTANDAMQGGEKITAAPQPTAAAKPPTPALPPRKLKLNLELLNAYLNAMTKEQAGEFALISMRFIDGEGTNRDANLKIKQWFDSHSELSLNPEVMQVLFAEMRDNGQPLFSNTKDANSLDWRNHPSGNARLILVEILTKIFMPTAVAVADEDSEPMPSPPEYKANEKSPGVIINLPEYSFNGKAEITRMGYELFEGTETITFPKSHPFWGKTNLFRSRYKGTFANGKRDGIGAEKNLVPELGSISTNYEGSRKAGHFLFGKGTVILGDRIEDLDRDIYLMYIGPIQNGLCDGQGLMNGLEIGRLMAVCPSVQNGQVKTDVSAFVQGQFIKGELPTVAIPSSTITLNENEIKAILTHYYLNIDKIRMHLRTTTEDYIDTLRDQAILSAPTLDFDCGVTSKEQMIFSHLSKLRPQPIDTNAAQADVQSEATARRLREEAAVEFKLSLSRGSSPSTGSRSRAGNPVYKTLMSEEEDPAPQNDNTKNSAVGSKKKDFKFR